MGHFINAREHLVAEAVEGLLLSSGGALAKLDGDPAIQVVLRADWRGEGVALVSGGGSGHEPAHAGLVGPGLLTAAVCGDVFASPTADAVLAAILAVTGDAGCLVIIKNYAGDRLNFGLAAERARAAGLKVETVTVADDIAIEGAAQPRGIAGTLFVHKVAGQAAASGKPLAEVAEAARKAAAAAKSLGVSLSSCTIPGTAPEPRLKHGEAELGLGIHGEPGYDKIALPAVDALADLMMQRLAGELPPSGDLAMLVNNLGATTPLEMGVLTRALLATELGRRVKLLLGPAPAMTSLDMHGISVSLIPTADGIGAALEAPTEVAAWPTARKVAAPVLRPLPAGLGDEVQAEASQEPAVAARITAVCDALIAAEVQLNALDAKVGDGDTGSTFAAGARAIKASLDKLPLADPAKLCEALSRRLARSSGGSSGVLLSIFFAAIGGALASGASWPAAVKHGIERMQVHGGAKAGDRTMLDALIPAAEALASGTPKDAAAAAQRGAEATASMRKAGAGRSTYLAAASLEGHPDPGAVAVAKAFAALAG
ncbi:Dihydroxyacetone kinase [Beijerinckiaceae bacterium RH CH11]|nr:dihydroxyacetone kinase subunit DhaK [Beijerinckiaceae bacterium]VVB45873.1 Dihydroxyacetone kinase [Beijerinckiaceae bacterium RH CH11]VVB45951.1 Dihydroxyacetone kinase [Beijerinckiaceae bacterium RH AL8]